MLNLIILDNIKAFFKEYSEVTFENVKAHLCKFNSTKLCRACRYEFYSGTPCKECEVNFEYARRNYDFIKEVDKLIMKYINKNATLPLERKE